MSVVFVYLQKLVAVFAAIISLLGINANTETVELYDNPLSGYTWEYSLDNPGVLTLTQRYYTPDSSAIFAGGGGTQHFTFRAIGNGTVNITFKYVKILDKTVASTYVYTYYVDSNGEITLKGIK